MPGRGLYRLAPVYYKETGRPLRTVPEKRQSIKMKKKFYTALTVLVSSLCAVACNGENSKEIDGAAALNVSPAAVSLDPQGAAASVEVTADKSWGSYTSDSWLKVSPETSLEKITEVSISATPNTGEEERVGTVTFKSGTTRKEVTVTQAPGGKADDTYYAPEGYELVWHDEFNVGTTLDSDWTHEVQRSGWVNNELQNYVNGYSPEGVPVTEMKDGRLRIRCFKENGKIYSGRVYAKVKEGWKYGYIEASIKLPKGRGTWPAFWMMPVHFTSWPADGEIDIMEEVGANPNYVSSSLHANSHVHSNGTQVTHEMYCEGAESEFHTYAIEWTADNITTYVDGKVQLSYDNRGLGRDDWPYDAPFYVILNLAWGGDWGGYKGVDESALPAIMEVDYVRVFQKK